MGFFREVKITMSAVLIRHRWTVSDFRQMIQTGVLSADDRVELIEGELIDRPPIGPLHAGVSEILGKMLRSALARTVSIRSQKPLCLGNNSELEPDIFIAERDRDFYRRAHPTPAQVHLVIEVADMSLTKDREVKLPLYAAHGVPEAWLVNLAEARLEIYRQPLPAERRYVQVAVHTAGIIAPARFPTVRVDVAALFGSV